MISFLCGMSEDKSPAGKAEIAQPIRSRFKFLALTILVCLPGFVVLSMFQSFSTMKVGENNYLILHIILELISIIISFMVFTAGWYGYKQLGNRQDLFIGVLFMVVGLIDFLHVLSYQGMPNFITENTVSKAATYWIIARLVTAIGLLTAAFVEPESNKKKNSPTIYALSGLLIVLASALVVTNYPGSIPPMFIDGIGLTPIKIFLEQTVVYLFIGAIIIFGIKNRGAENITLLQSAIIISIFSELSFTLYRSAFDLYNLLGHIYKAAAYFVIFRSLFLSSFDKPYLELSRAHDQIERSFSRIGEALASGLELNDLLSLISELSAEMLGTSSSAVFLLEDGRLRLKTQTGLLNPHETVPFTHTSAGIAFSSKKPVFFDDVDKMPDHDPGCHCKQVSGAPTRSVVSAPITSEQNVYGVIEVYSPHVGAFGEKEAALLSSFARQAAAAIVDSMVFERERAVANMLQMSLLPPIPERPGLDIAVKYESSDDITKVGGDLYDVFPLDDDNLALVIGDTSGHGLEAASMMAMTIYMLKGFLGHGMKCHDALKHTNSALCRRLAEDDYSGQFVTVFAGRLNLRTLKLEYSNAGHHMPLIIRSDSCEPMDIHTDIPLGIEDTMQYNLYDADLNGANGLLFYTDGIIEANKDGDFFGVDRVCEICEEMNGKPAKQLTDEIVSRAREWSTILHDDAAMLAVIWKNSD